LHDIFSDDAEPDVDGDVDLEDLDNTIVVEEPEDEEAHDDLPPSPPPMLPPLSLSLQQETIQFPS
jgi:hypothetical protein